MLLTTSRRRASRLLPLTLLLAALTLAASPFRAAAQYILSAEEAAIAGFMVSDPDQQRPEMHLDPILSQVARERAQDLADRDYFAHTNPDGYAANYLVRQAGYELPAWWGTGNADNFIESIAAGFASPADTYADWMDSPGHRTHILALAPFYQNQTSYGVGYAYSPTSTYKHYWVILTAPPSVPEENAALVLSQTAPASMIAGSTYNVSVSVRNTGSNTWTQAEGYRLAAQAPAYNTTWGLSQIALPGNVTPGSEVTFNFTVTAPATAGTHAFQWRMAQEGVGPFGEPTHSLPVAVSNALPPPPAPAPAPYVAPAPAAVSYSAPSSSSSSSKSKKKKKKKAKKKKSKKKKK